MQNDRTTLKHFYSLNDLEKTAIREKIETIARKHFDDGNSISVCIRRTYNETNFTIQLCESVIRSSSLMSFYEKRHKLKRGLQKFNYKQNKFYDSNNYGII